MNFAFITDGARTCRSRRNGRSSSMTRAQPSASVTSNNMVSTATPASAAAAATISAFECDRTVPTDRNRAARARSPSPSRCLSWHQS